ncbi:MAG: TolC family protein [Planctomycetota bacterium]
MKPAHSSIPAPERNAALLVSVVCVALVGWISGCRSTELTTRHDLETPVVRLSSDRRDISPIRPCSTDEAISIDEELSSVRGLLNTPQQATAWSLQDAEAVALQTHPAIRKQRSTLQAARGQFVQAGLPFNPVAQYLSEEIGNDDSTGLHSLTISRQFATANRLGIAQQVQVREYQKQQARLRSAELRVTNDVRTAFALALVAQQRTELSREILKLAAKSEAAVKDLVDAEEASKLSLLQAKVETEQTRIDFENAAARHRAALRVLAAAVGDPSIEESRLLGELQTPDSDQPWAPLLQQLSANSPELSLATAELDRARCALQLACAQVVPNITGQAGVGYDSMTDDTFAVVGVSVPIPIRNRNQGNIQSARARISAAADAIDETQLSLERRLASSVGQYEIAKQQYERLSDSVIPAAEEAYELAVQAYEVGEADYLQLLTAQRTLFEKRLRQLDASGRAAAAANQIDTWLVGLPF